MRGSVLGGKLGDEVTGCRPDGSRNIDSERRESRTDRFEKGELVPRVRRHSMTGTMEAAAEPFTPAFDAVHGVVRTPQQINASARQVERGEDITHELVLGRLLHT